MTILSVTTKLPHESTSMAQSPRHFSAYEAGVIEMCVPYTSAFAFGNRQPTPGTSSSWYTDRQIRAIQTDAASRQNFTAVREVSTFVGTTLGAAALIASKAFPPWLSAIGLVACAFTGSASLGLGRKYGYLPQGKYPQDELRRIYPRQ